MFLFYRIKIYIFKKHWFCFTKWKQLKLFQILNNYKLIGDIAPSTLIDIRDNWYLRKKLILHDVYKNKAQLIYDCRQSDKQISLAIFKPARIISFHIETAKYKATECQTYKLPFKFYYKFIDENGISSRLQIIDWEIGELTRKLLRQYKDDFVIIKSILRQKYFDNMITRDIHLFLGTSREWHIRKSPNPFMIIGVFYPPHIVEVVTPQEHNLQIENKSFTINQKIIERSYAVQI